MAGENQTNSLSGRSIDVGVVLRALRQSAHLTQQQLGQILGISTRRVGACEHNQTRVMPLIFIRWCRACGHDPAEAMTWLTASESNKVIAQRSDIAIQRKSLFRNQPKTVKTISK